MRSDMWKVIVERPRLGRGYAASLSNRARKLLPHDHDGDTLDVIDRSVRTQRSKSLNENLAPLRRYLERQVGRPWDKVYGEMRAHISFDNVVQKHVFEHLEQMIELRPQIVDGVLYTESGWPLVSRRRIALYVDPRTGIIRKPRPRDRADKNARRDDLASLGSNACLLKVDGVWWHVTLAATPARRFSAPHVRVIDVVTKRAPDYTYWSPPGAWHRYGAPNVYAVAKRQASKRELREHRRAGRIR
jgi:hypothetical protein